MNTPDQIVPARAGEAQHGHGAWLVKDYLRAQKSPAIPMDSRAVIFLLTSGPELHRPHQERHSNDSPCYHYIGCYGHSR